MKIIPEIAANKDEMVAWRRDIHAHPELAYEEERTAGLVAERLEEWGLAVHRGLATTGVVGTLSTGNGPTVGLRADMDALPIQETNSFGHRSRHDGKMHACGHDGHTSCLVGAAKVLGQIRDELEGPVKFIFQPAEEGGAGGKRMCEEDALENPKVDAIFGLHGWPAFPQEYSGRNEFP